MRGKIATIRKAAEALIADSVGESGVDVEMVDA